MRKARRRSLSMNLYFLYMNYLLRHLLGSRYISYNFLRKIFTVNESKRWSIGTWTIPRLGW